MLLPSARQFEAFMQVARLTSFRRAAETLHMSQPALSQSISQLERQLGTALFHRDTRNVRLTAAGEMLFQRLGRILPELHEAVDAIRSIGELQAGRLRVGCVASAALRFLPGVLSTYRTRFPRVKVLVRDGTADVLHKLVLGGEIDFALSSSAPLPSEELEFERLFVESFRAVVPRQHPLAKRRSVTWNDLFAYDVIGFSFGSGIRHSLDVAFAQNGQGQRPVMELSQLATVIGMVEAGLGVAPLPEMCCPAIDHPVLCSLPLTGPDVKRDIGLVSLRGSAQPDPVAAFRRLLVQSTERDLEHKRSV